MVKKRVSLLATAALIASMAAACAEPPEQGLKVDLKTMVASGEVQPVDGITSAGQPSEAALQVFAENGYQTVIDIRGAREKRGMNERRVVESLGMGYIALPIEGSDAINFDNATKLNELIANADGPVLVHCGSGNRVGALLALRQSLNGADDATALALGKAGGLTRLEPTVREVLSKK